MFVVALAMVGSVTPVAAQGTMTTLNAAAVGSAVTNASGLATVSGVSLAGLAAGSYPNAVHASFAGDGSLPAATGTASLQIAQAVPVVSWSSPPDVVVGAPLTSTHLNASANVPGTFTYSPPAGTLLAVGIGQTLSATFVPADTANYTGALATTTINAVVLTTTFVYPLNGTSTLDLTRNFEWTSVPNAQAYVLYIGTSVGANDVVNSGSLLQTSYQVTATLPLNCLLYARLWTKVGGVWRATDGSGQIVDVSFSVVPPNTPTWVYPTNGLTTLDLSRNFEWTTVANAQAYVLYIGTTMGASDVLNSGSIQQTSYHVNVPLPTDRALYARVWTKVGGVWRATDWYGRTVDVSFSVVALPTFATFVYPTNGTTTLDLTRNFQWTPVAFAEMYVLYIGTSPGAADLLNSGALFETSYTVPSGLLPTNRWLYARLWTLVAGVWTALDATGRPVDVAFSVVPLPTTAAFVSPSPGATISTATVNFQWTDIHAQTSVLYIGTSPGASNLLNSGALYQTSYNVAASSLPAGVTLYARLWTKVQGVWRAINAAGQLADVSFSITPVAPPPTSAVFQQSTDHASLGSYRLDIFANGANVATATPIATSDLGKPAPAANGDITVNRATMFSALAPGSYQATVTAINGNGSTRSVAVVFTR